MNTLNLMHHPPRSKKAIVGGPLARAIYGAGGLADRLRAARARNTEDQGRPAMNDDGTRTYHLVEASAESRCEFCGRWTVGADGECRFCSLSRVEMVGCGDCHCPAGSDAQTRVGDLTVTCHCDCHHCDDEEVVYSGKRFVVRNGEQVEAWEVYRNGEPFIGNRGKRTGYAWGTSKSTTAKSFSLTVDILEDVDGHGQHTFDLSDRIINSLPDFWHLTRSEVLELIRSCEAKEVSHG